jgi:DNA polymerase-3 subunit epsilon
VPRDAENIHGLGDAFLRDKPVFASIAAGFLDFVGDARLVIHNAAFDLRMLNAELGRLALPLLAPARATDTLAIARRRFPGAQASLDALCRRFGIDNSGREKHGALLDTELLAEVYLELMGGRQQGLVLVAAGTTMRGPANAGDAGGQSTGVAYRAPPRPRPLAPLITMAEQAAHDRFIAELGENALWRTQRRQAGE